MTQYVPRREVVEHVFYRCTRGGRNGRFYHPVWMASTDGLEGTRTKHGFVSTCAVFVNCVLRDCGCAEPWVMPQWVAGSRLIRWDRSLEIAHPRPSQLIPGDILVWRVGSPLVHTEFYLGRTVDGGFRTGGGGKPGGKVTCRRDLGLPDLALPLDRLRWNQGTAPTVGQWLEQRGLPPGECSAEQFLCDADLARMDMGIFARTRP